MGEANTTFLEAMTTAHDNGHEITLDTDSDNVLFDVYYCTKEGCICTIEIHHTSGTLSEQVGMTEICPYDIVKGR